MKISLIHCALCSIVLLVASIVWIIGLYYSHDEFEIMQLKSLRAPNIYTKGIVGSNIAVTKIIVSFYWDTVKNNFLEMNPHVEDELQVYIEHDSFCIFIQNGEVNDLSAFTEIPLFGQISLGENVKISQEDLQKKYENLVIYKRSQGKTEIFNIPVLKRMKSLWYNKGVDRKLE